jgi:hypothetical protein
MMNKENLERAKRPSVIFQAATKAKRVFCQLIRAGASLRLPPLVSSIFLH